MHVVDGKFFVVAGTGSLQISHDILLENVLHVPSLSYNLLSICKLTTDPNCYAHFSKSTCVFQDLKSGKRIGNARVINGLYYLYVIPL